jgi:glycosyltransferase involved in cell wall biosynthesis
MKKKKILHFDYDDLANPYAGGGQAKATRQIYSRLSKKYDVDVITGNYPNASDQSIEGINYKRIGIGSFGPSISIISYWLLIPLYALLNLKKNSYVSEFFTAPFSVSFLPYIAKNVVGCPTFFDPEALSKKYHLPFGFVTRTLIKKYKRIIANSDFIKSRVEKYNPTASISVIPRGIEDDYLQIVPNEGNYFLYIGRIDLFNKGLDLAIDTWVKVVKKYPMYKFIIAGSGKNSDIVSMQKLIESRSLLKTVKMIGQVTGNKKISLYAKCFAVVQPSKFETFSNVALEAMAIQKPLICFDISGLKWIPKDCAFKSEDITTDGLLEQFFICIENKSRRKKTAMKARMYSSKFKWQDVANQYEKVFLAIK